MSWVSCCRGRKNCPSVALDDEHLLIKDDDGSVAKIKLEAVEGLLLTIQELIVVRDGLVDLQEAEDGAVLT